MRAVKDKTFTTDTPRDLAEEAALDRAASGLQKFMTGGGYTPRSLASVAISEWIIARASMIASGRIGSQHLLFDLKDSRLRGYIEAALPSIAAALEHIDPEAPLFSLEKDAVVDVFLAGIAGAREAAVLVAEAPLTDNFDDAIPFG
jgi:hypothetical protein